MTDSLLDKLSKERIVEKWDCYNDCPSGEFHLGFGQELKESEAKQLLDLIRWLVMQNTITQESKS